MVLSRYSFDTGRHFSMTGRITAKLAETCVLRKVGQRPMDRSVRT